MIKHLYSPLEAFKTDVLFSGTLWGNGYGFVHFPIWDTGTVGLLGLLLIWSLLILLICSVLIESNKAAKAYEGLIAFFCANLSPASGRFFLSFLQLVLLVSSCNVLGLLPLSPCFTSQLVFNIEMTFAIVFGSILMGLNGQGIMFVRHFIPRNVPIIMVPFLFVIEVISFFMRIFSMSIRLFSNMVAGHSLLHLLHGFTVYLFQLSQGNVMGILVSIVSLCFFYFWFLFEIFVALLQTYVFVLLFLLYLADLEKHDH